jgi:hypothetical protein
MVVLRYVTTGLSSSRYKAILPYQSVYAQIWKSQRHLSFRTWPRHQEGVPSGWLHNTAQHTFDIHESHTWIVCRLNKESHLHRIRCVATSWRPQARFMQNAKPVPSVELKAATPGATLVSVQHGYTFVALRSEQWIRERLSRGLRLNPGSTTLTF